MKILLASHTPMGGDFVVGSHHLAHAFADAGHDVVHLATPVTPFHLLLAGRRSVRHRLAAALERVAVGDRPRVRQVAPISLVPGFVASFVTAVRDPVVAAMMPPLGPRLDRLGFRHVDLLLLDDPWLHGVLDVVVAQKLVYRPTDLYGHMTGPRAVVLEQRVMKRVDGVVATSEPVREDVLARAEGGGLPAIVVENGVDVAHMSATRAAPAEYERLPSPRVVYTGALDQRFDDVAVFEAARRLQDVSFVLIGPAPRGPWRRAPANVHLLGPRPHAELPAYLQHADVGILPLSEHPANRGRSPLKLYEYLASGLPVVARATSELDRRATPHVRLYRVGDELASALERTLAAPPEPARCRAAAEGHDWKEVAGRILEFSREVPPRRASRHVEEGSGARRP